MEKGKILCCQRGPERALANLWEFPGGKIENGETEVQALERGARRIKNRSNDRQGRVCFCRYEYDFGFVNLTTFICYLESGEPQLTEHLQIKWLTPNELNQLEWAPADIPTVEKLVEKGVGTEQNG